MKELVIILNTKSELNNPSEISFDELQTWISNGSILKRLFSYDRVTLRTYRIGLMIRPFLLALIIRLLSRGACKITDEENNLETITLPKLAKIFFKLFSEYPQTLSLKSKINNYLSKVETTPHVSIPPLNFNLAPVYLRTDLWFGTLAGGSVTHISGVLNNFETPHHLPTLYSSDVIPMCKTQIQQVIISPENKFWDFGEIPSFNYNHTFIEAFDADTSADDFSFVYQRYSLNNYVGIELARKHQKALVLEYNGSEVWISRNWGRPLKNEKLSQRIEDLNLNRANLIVVVSEAMKEELVLRNIEPNKILVNPNGVDADHYHPKLHMPKLAAKLSLERKTVIGFIGTFGAWHGAEQLAKAFTKLLSDNPELKDKVRLLMIGDGVKMAAVKEIIEAERCEDYVCFTGLIPQKEGASYLSICDILISPHVPNPDNSPFFGSPTKLFEYMSMGKAIVASQLAQIGEVLEDNNTAILVEPGNFVALADAILRLIRNPILREKLGGNARIQACEQHTWQMHTQKIINALKSQLI